MKGRSFTHGLLFKGCFSAKQDQGLQHPVKIVLIQLSAKQDQGLQHPVKIVLIQACGERVLSENRLERKRQNDKESKK